MGVKHLANSDTEVYYIISKIETKIFCSSFGAAVAKTFNKCKEIPPNPEFETLSLFSQVEFPEKEGVYQTWIGHAMLLERLILIKVSFSLEVQAERTDLGFQKLFTGISFCIC